MAIFTLDYIHEARSNTQKNNKIDPSTISYSKSFKDVKDIIDNLSKKEKSHITNNDNFTDSPNVKYRKVTLINKDPAAFIDVYSAPGELEKDEAIIICACKKQYRRGGLIKLCYNGLENEVRSKGIKTIYWETTKDNPGSAKLAKSLGFSKGDNINKDDDNYVKHL